MSYTSNIPTQLIDWGMKVMDPKLSAQAKANYAMNLLNAQQFCREVLDQYNRKTKRRTHA